MEGLCYTSSLTYSYTCKLDYIVRIAKLDNFTQHNIVQEQNIIEYVIDHSNCVKLSDLLYWISQKFVRMHLYQIIWMCLEIIQKYYALIKQGIQHNYLSTDRVWIKLKPGTEKFRIVYSKLYYTIHFVGYSCPFYERQDYEQYQIKDQTAIENIVKEILSVAQKHLRKTVREKACLCKLFQKLQQSCNQGLLNVQMQIFQIIDQYRLDVLSSGQNPQRLFEIDFNYNTQSLIGVNRRVRKVEVVTQNIQQFIKQTYSENEWFLFEQLFYNIVPYFVKEIKNYIYNTVTLQVLKQSHALREQMNLDSEAIQQLINQYEDEKNMNFKFEINRKELESNILIYVTKRIKKLHYFYNNVEFVINFNDELKNQVLTMKQTLLKECTKQVYEEMQEQKIYELALDLI